VASTEFPEIVTISPFERRRSRSHCKFEVSPPLELAAVGRASRACDARSTGLGRTVALPWACALPTKAFGIIPHFAIVAHEIGHALCDRVIWDGDSNLEHRLVVSPILEESEQLKSSSASIDVRLGCDFAFVSPSQHGAIDDLSASNIQESKVSLGKLYIKLYVPLGSYVNIHPHQFVLAQALEYLRLPIDLMAYVVESPCGTKLNAEGPLIA
jgi:hypothetical protein